MNKFFKIVFTLLYISTLSYIVFFARRRQSMHTIERYKLVNKMPVVNKLREYRYITYNYNKREAKNFFINIFGNIILFLPLPLVFVWFLGSRSFVQLIIVAIITSIIIELIQFLLKLGVADVDDVILNTSGAAIGILFLRLIPKSFLVLNTAKEI